MIRREILLSAALTLVTVVPGLAAPTLKATVSHMCCGNCENSVKRDASGVAWVGEAQTDRASKSVSVTAKAGMPVDAMALFTALHAGGFPPTSYQLSGARSIQMDVGHICCGGCATSVKSALGQVAWIKSADVKVNAPVMLTIDPAKTVDLSDLMLAMMKAGFSPTTMLVRE